MDLVDMFSHLAHAATTGALVYHVLELRRRVRELEDIDGTD